MQTFNIIAVLAGLAAAVSWGTSDFFAANASRKINPLVVTILVMIFTAVSYSIFYALGLRNNNHWSGEGIALAAVAGLMMTLAVTAFYRGLSIGTVSIVSPIGAAYPLVTTILTMIIFQATLLPYQVFGIILTVVGIMVTAGLLGAKRSELKLDAGVLMALIACIGWGIRFAFLGKAVTLLGWENASLIDVWFMVVGCLVVLPFVKFGDVFGKQGMINIRNPFVLGGAFLQTTGVVALNFGFIHAISTAVETTISASYPILTVLLAYVFFKERVSTLTKFGIVATIVGVAIISYR